MCTLKHRALTLVAALAVVAAGCSGNNGKGGADGQNGNNGDPGAPGSSVPPGISNSGLAVEVTGTGVDAANQVTVTFTMKDVNGLPVDINGVFSVNTAIQPLFALAYISTAADGSVLPYTVLTTSGTPAQPTAFNPLKITNGALDPTANGVLTPSATTPGTYTYTFPASVALDTTKAANTHTIWIQAARQTDLDDTSNTKTFTAVNEEFNFLPNGGTPAPAVAKREVVLTANCSKCHSNFKPEGLVSNEFHTGGRMEAPFCNVCHNVGRVSNPSASAETFIHRIHSAKDLQVFTSGTRTVGSQGTNTCTDSKPCTCTALKPCSNAFHGIDETAYPQDLRNCAACHDKALQGDQYKTRPTRAACGSCHDYVDFAGTVASVACTSPLTLGADGKPVACVHFAGVQTNDDGCAGCHSPTLNGAPNPAFIEAAPGARKSHVPVAEVNPANILIPVTSGTVTAGVQVTKTCTPGQPCTDCQATQTTTGTGAIFPVINSVTNCIDTDYKFIGSTAGAPTTVTDTAFFNAAGVACGTGTIVAGATKIQPAPCTCTDAAPCFANPYTKLGATLTAGVTTTTAGFGGGTACGNGLVTATGTNPSPCTCTPASPCIGAGNNNTNAASVAAAGAVPAGAAKLSYDLKSVSRDASKHPVMVFRILQNDARVDFNAFNTAASAAGQELWPNFVGSPSLYWVYAVPQDSILKPADFNGSTSVYLRSLWNHTATTTSVGTLAGPDADGYYTATLTGSLIPDNATMLTGGIGYTYGLTTTPPFAQTNVSGFPYGDVAPAAGVLAGAGSVRQGGLIVPAADVKKVATGYTGRRQIIDNAKCQNCHVTLGANPTFHAGQRNDGESCSWCHNPNQNNSGWSGNAKDMIHALHAGTAAGVALPNGTLSAGTGKRSYPYTWDAVSQSEGFWEVTFPGPRNNCEACHATLANPLQHTYDFSAPDSAAAVPNLLWSTDATNAVTLQNFVSSVFGSSPYVAAVTTGTITAGTQGAVTCTVAASCTCTVQNPCLSNFGANAGFDKVAGVLTDGAATNLVTSPITAACIACHDSPTQKSHIIAMNGQFYVARSVAKGLATNNPTDPNQESCLICHGPQPNSIAPIADMHK